MNSQLVVAVARKPDPGTLESMVKDAKTEFCRQLHEWEVLFVDFRGDTAALDIRYDQPSVNLRGGTFVLTGVSELSLLEEARRDLELSEAILFFARNGQVYYNQLKLSEGPK